MLRQKPLEICKRLTAPASSTFVSPTRSFFSWMTGSSSSNALTKSHSEHKVVPFSQEEMFNVVADVSKYHEFLPFCVESTIVSRKGEEEMDAKLRIGFKIFTESYTSRVTMKKPERITTRAVNSPIFKRIDGDWEFTPTKSPDECRVDFKVTFEVGSYLHANAIQLFFDDVAATQLNAFIGRAHQLKKRRGNGPKPPNGGNGSRSIPSKESKPDAGASKQDKASSPSATNKEGAKMAVKATQSANAFIKKGMHAEDYHELADVFDRYAVEEDGAKKMYLDGFTSACHELSQHFLEVKEMAENPALAGAVVYSLDTSGEAKTWLTLDEFAVGVYLMTKGSTQEKALSLFHLIDTSTSQDGRISREDLTTAMQRRIRSVQKMFPKLVADQINALSSGENKTLDEFRRNGKYTAGLETVKKMLQEIEEEVPLAVNRIFLEADLDQDDYIGEEEWLFAWQAHPEFVEMLTIDGMAKLSQWSYLIKDGGEDEENKVEDRYGTGN